MNVEVSTRDIYLKTDDKINTFKNVNIILFLLTTAHFLVAFLVDEKRAMFNYLLSFLFIISLGLGGLFFTLLQHATKATWSVVVRRISESFTQVLVWGILLVLPIFAGLNLLYEWSDPSKVASDHLLQHKSIYLNDIFFMIRTLLYFGAWVLLYLKVIKPSLLQDHTGDVTLSHKMWKWSCAGILLFGITLHYASVDWLMSLTPKWYSTIFGIYFFAGCIVSALSILILTLLLLKKGGYLSLVNENHFHDIGKLLFGLNVFWAYIAFSQYMLIWYGNLPEETVFFYERNIGNWKNVTLILPIGHFVIPFLLLISRTAKRNQFLLGFGALWLLVMHYIDLFWIVLPTFSKDTVPFGLMEIASFIWALSLFFYLVLRELQKRALIPLKDPRLQQSLEFHQ